MTNSKYIRSHILDTTYADLGRSFRIGIKQQTFWQKVWNIITFK